MRLRQIVKERPAKEEQLRLSMLQQRNRISTTDFSVTRQLQERIYRNVLHEGVYPYFWYQSQINRKRREVSIIGYLCELIEKYFIQLLSLKYEINPLTSIPFKGVSTALKDALTANTAIQCLNTLYYAYIGLIKAYSQDMTRRIQDEVVQNIVKKMFHIESVLGTFVPVQYFAQIVLYDYPVPRSLDNRSGIIDYFDGTTSMSRFELTKKRLTMLEAQIDRRAFKSIQKPIYKFYDIPSQFHDLKSELISSLAGNWVDQVDQSRLSIADSKIRL